KQLGILQDLQGPKIRVGEIDGEIILKKGQAVILNGKSSSNGVIRIPLTYKSLHKDIKSGNRILLDDGLIELLVESVFKKDIRAIVKVGGTLISHKGINLPDSVVKLSSLTKKDKEDLKFGLKKKVDFIALSFVRNKDDVLELLKLLPKKNPPFIIAKIEKHEAIKNFDKILEVVDGIMVARGDLALEIQAEKVPVAQKDMIIKCLAIAKPVIVATQMLHTMIEKPRPTRAEVSDVANAVIDHSDALMLSGESAVGKYPVKAVETMARIIKNAENSKYDDLKPCLVMSEVSRVLSEAPKSKAIIVVSDSAETARKISRIRPELPIYASVTNERESRELLLSWGVKPFFLSKRRRIKGLDKKFIKFLKKKKLLKPKNKIILVKSEKGNETVEKIN
ncbi:MAG: pyruvate kinase, partial [Patescibacteria group bacterium]|nr:pyruvate kinase [Patescibacteria group bacterium]